MLVCLVLFCCRLGIVATETFQMLQKLIDSLRIQVVWDMVLCHWVGGFQGHTVTSQNPLVLRHTAVKSSDLAKPQS